MPKNPAIYTWSESERQYRDRFGRFVSPDEVRKSLDRYLDVLEQEAGSITESMVNGDVQISVWQKRMESILKRGHTSATAIAKGGWKQAGPADWGKAGSELKAQYEYLARFAKQLEDGRPVHGGTVARAKMYALSATGTYESIRHADMVKAGYDIHRRLLHSLESCEDCEGYANLGWQPVAAKNLPPIGKKSKCKVRCRCTFDYMKSKKSAKEAAMSILGDAWHTVTSLARGGGAGKRARKAKRQGKAGGGKRGAPGCKGDSGRFPPGNTCGQVEGGAKKEDGPLTKKAKADAAKVEWTRRYDDGTERKMKGLLTKKINVQGGPPRNAKEQKLLSRAEKSGKTAIVRKEVLGATKYQDGAITRFNHGDDVAVSVMLTKDVPTLKPRLTNKKGYDPADHEATKTSKFTVIDHRGGVSGHPTRQKAEAVARDRVTELRRIHTEEGAEYKLVKDVNKANLIDGTDFGTHRNARIEIRVLRPKKVKSGPSGEGSPKLSAKFNEEKCRKRAKIAAIRDGVEAAPILIHPSKTKFLVDGGRKRVGGKDESAMRAINATLGGKGKQLTSDDVYIHYVEAANTNFIGDRFMFLDTTTLKNIAVAAGSGIAFMNSHRTGGLSAPSELPFGRTFAGKYEEMTRPDGSRGGRTLIGLYMLKGVYPNGTMGPSTDDLHRSIEAGTLSDVSMGLMGGVKICDVCGQDLSERDPETGKFGCPHAPGTHKSMEPDHVQAQTERGVQGGRASYTLVDATPQEVSAVYKGAVPGAGFRKAMLLSKLGELTTLEAKEARESFSGLVGRGETVFGTTGDASKGSKGPMDLLKAFRFWQAAGEPEKLDLGEIAAMNDVDPGKRNEVAATITSRADEDTKLSEREASLRAEARKVALGRAELEADKKLSPMIASGQLTPFEADQYRLAYTLASLDDQTNPAFDPKDGTTVLKRLDVLSSLPVVGKGTGKLQVDVIPDADAVNEGETVLNNGVKPVVDDAIEGYRLAAMTPMGLAGLRTFDEGRKYLASVGKS